MENYYTQNIYELYENYISWSTGFIASQGGMNFLRRFFMGNSEYNKCTEHMEFFHGVEEAAAEYLRAVNSGEGREELAPLLRYVLADCHAGRDEGTEWMLLATEKSFIPFLELLTAGEAAQLYELYRPLRRKNRGLPPQDEIRKKLKNMSK